MTPEPLRELLAQLGYAVHLRGGPLTECLVSRGLERWQGGGACENEALDDVVRQMLPSGLARQLLTDLFSVAGWADSSTSKDRQPLLAPEALQGDGARSTSAGSAHGAPPPGAPPAAIAPAHTAPEPPAGSAAASINGARADRSPPTGFRGVRAAIKSDTGAVRARNDDAGVVMAERGLAVVADGVGRRPAGDVASKLAVETVRKAFATAAGLTPVRQKALPAMVAAVARANEVIFHASARDPKLRGMATTLAAALMVGRQGVIAHVGDSRVYRLRGGVLELLTTDHSTLNQQLRTRDPIEGAPNGLTRALGARPTVDVDTSVVTLQPGDMLLLSTDGLHGVVGHEELNDILASGSDPETVVEELVARANELGGPDNVTATVLQWDR